MIRLNKVESTDNKSLGRRNRGLSTRELGGWILERLVVSLGVLDSQQMAAWCVIRFISVKCP